ncbi:MAG: type IV toxin-antitoxin system AbiEi family antitoxin [Candidatus Omnitrophica bacterium]|nr:type IV toxin-antitoxin system AbiEi family antitoxin [Candidatus Omnitrophota bacterium]MBU4488854.1 type IV toxin-antitoxin system AbiEi family antitoxin [Candidatus Omnitrophota bacterium]
MNNPTNGKNIFADKATFILRKMLSSPGKKWVTRDFTGENGVSLGMAQGVLEAMTKKGYIERVKRGPDSYALLTNTRELVEDWVAVYQFELNDIHTYYSADKSISPKLKDCLKDKQYAFTLHSGANLITSFVVTDQVYVYFSPENWKKELLDLRQQMDLKELVRGGNIHIIRPFYKNSAFYNTQMIKGYKVVSNLQLYLDLYNFKPRGKEHAEYLKQSLKEKGKDLYES